LHWEASGSWHLPSTQLASRSHSRFSFGAPHASPSGIGSTHVPDVVSPCCAQSPRSHRRGPARSHASPPLTYTIATHFFAAASHASPVAQRVPGVHAAPSPGGAAHFFSTHARSLWQSPEDVQSAPVAPRGAHLAGPLEPPIAHRRPLAQRPTDDDGLLGSKQTSPSLSLGDASHVPLVPSFVEHVAPSTQLLLRGSHG
jgi:hypothetical protein